MRLLNRKVLLILDNASCQKIDSKADQLTDVKVAFLAQNTTSHFQYMGAGIIKNSSYITKLNHFLNTIEVERKIIFPNIKEAFYMAKKLGH